MNQSVDKHYIDKLLEDITVHEPGTWENDKGPEDWYAVSTEGAGCIIASFQYPNDAYAFRLSYINRLLNPITD